MLCSGRAADLGKAIKTEVLTRFNGQETCASGGAEFLPV